MILVGDVTQRVCVLVDDMADTCGTLGLAAKVLKDNGATKVYALVTHPILSGKALDVINDSQLEQVAVTNTIPLDGKQQLCPKLKVMDISATISEAIRRIHHGESVLSFFFS